MYHHFSGKSALALEALRRSAAEMRSIVDADLNEPGSAYDRISAYLLRSRDVMRGCPVGGLAQDPDIVADPVLREPVAATFGWLQARLAELIRSSGEFKDIDPDDTAAAVVAVVQGGYVLARAAGTPEPFEQAVNGALGMLRAATR